MYRVILLLLLITSCSQKNRETSNKTVDDFIWQMTDKVQEYLTLPTTDSLRLYLTRIEDSVKLLKYDRLSFYWNLAKIQQSVLDQNTDSSSFFTNNVLALSKVPGITEIDLLNFYVIYEELLLRQQLLDSALQVANNAYFIAKRSAASRLATTSYQLSRIYGLLEDLPNMKKYMFEAWQHSNVEPEMKGVIGNTIAYYYNRLGKIDSAIYYLKEFQKDSLIDSSPKLLAEIYDNTAVLLNQKGNLQEGLKYQLKAKTILDALGDSDPGRYLNLGETYGRLQKYNKGIETLDSAILLAKEQRNYLLLRSAWQNKSINYYNKLDYKNACDALDSAYTYYGIEIDSSLRETARELEKKYEVKEKDNKIQSLAFQNETNKKIKTQQQIIIIILSFVMLLSLTVAMLLWRRKQMRTQLHEAQLEQQMLRSQMEPHFIFNSLGVLQSFIRNEDKEKSINYLGEFSKLLRQTLNNARESLVPLQDEVEMLKNYLHLQSVNFAGKFTYTVNLHDSCQDDEILIPPMLMQPFVENAILHGIAKVTYKGNIDVQIQRNTDQLHCIIEDNGVGLHTTTGEMGRSLSTQITQERLSILARQTGRQAKLIILDKQVEGDGQGVKVILDIPFLTIH